MALIKPVRIQRKRTKGFSLQDASPNGLPVVYVGRPGPWGNPWTVKAAIESGLFEPDHAARICKDEFDHWLSGYWHEHTSDLEMLKTLEPRRKWILEHIHELRGKNLACWCKDGEPCHADILLILANK